ncbi:Fc.00g043030.m01.CDS01 [Cosmosporella sp. VM-42]
MLFNKIAPIAALVASTSAQQWTEIDGGYKYILSGPKNPAPKVEYERTTCAYAINLLSELQGTPVPEYGGDVEACKRDLLAIKNAQGPDGLLNLLQGKIADADKFWHAVNDNSSADGWVPVDGRAVTFLPNVTALGFAAWSASPFADAANNAANAEHYIKRTTATANGTLVSEILEGWGGVTTYFSIPNYGPPNLQQHPMLRPLPEFPIQAAGDKVLRDGTNEVFGVLHISIRDVDGADYGEAGKKGIEIYATVWYHDGAPEDHLELEREHIIIEIVNLSIQAQKDIASGAFSPSA